MRSMGRWRATISTRKRALRQALFSVHGQLCCHRPERQSMRTETASRTPLRSEEHTSELQSLMRISYAVFCLKKKNTYVSDRDQQQAVTTSNHTKQISK